MKDLLRYLLMCSYHDLSGGYPPIESPKIPIYSGSSSDNPENVERLNDYNLYREEIRFQSLLHRFLPHGFCLHGLPFDGSNSETESQS